MVLTGIALAVVLALTRGGTGGAPWGERIAILEIEGIIGDDLGYLETIRELRRDRSVKGFLVVINSPGGAVGPAQSIYSELRRIRDEDGLPVIATIGAVGASGGYYIALGADSIYALPGSLTGSIGVIMEIPQVEDLLDKVGIEMEILKSAEFKDAGSPFRPLDPADREVLQGLIIDVYDQFVTTVAEERRLQPAEARRLADGRVYSGRQALEAGLVDQIGNLNDALTAVGRMAGLGDEPKTIWPRPKRRTILDLLLSQVDLNRLKEIVRPFEQHLGTRIRFIAPISE